MGCGVLPPAGRREGGRQQHETGPGGFAQGGSNKAAAEEAHSLAIHGGYGGGGEGRRLQKLSLLSLGPGSAPWAWRELRTSGKLPAARLGLGLGLGLALALALALTLTLTLTCGEDGPHTARGQLYPDAPLRRRHRRSR